MSRLASDSNGGFLRFLTGRYLTPAMRTGLLAYKYDGEDRSFLYRYVLQPMNARLIQFVPMWIAPNLLTLFGLAWINLAYLLTYYYAPNFDKALPSWLYLLCAFCLWAYQTIDNLDGRQARRTGSSSPLGLLFDHGVDALNCTFASCILCSVYSIGQIDPIRVFAFWNIGFIPFFTSTWEEYYTGKLILGEVNGPSDGMACAMLFSSFGFFFPGIYFQTLGQALPSIFDKTSSFHDVYVHTIPLLIGVFGVVITVLGNFYQMSKKINPFGRPITKLFPFVLLWFCSWTWVLSMPTLFSAHMRVFCFACGFLFCQLICNLMICHVCDADFKPLRAVLLPLIGAWINCVLGPFIIPGLFPLVDPTTTLYALLLFNFSAWFHFIANAIFEITELLHIRCFVITPKDQGHDGATPAVVHAAELARSSPSPTPSPTGVVSARKTSSATK